MRGRRAPASTAPPSETRKMAAALARRALANHHVTAASLRCTYATKAEKKKGVDRKPTPRVYADAQSLAAKGFLRPQKEYVPPADVSEKLKIIFKNVIGNVDSKTELKDLKQRFNLFTSCGKEFDHHIPNSFLHIVETLGDIEEFYNTPVSNITPYDNLRNVELPENLHVQYEYHRFHPDTDKLFGGQTAFNESSTLVTGLKYKDKYKGHTQKIKYPWF